MEGGMTKYQLAKLISLAGGIKSRKRIQKTVHLLQAAGCPLNVSDYRIHYYGPYSKSLARLVDELTSAGMLLEAASDSDIGVQYEYRIDERVEKSMRRFEKTEHGSKCRDEMERYRDLLTELNDTRPRVLELASTVVAFRKLGVPWRAAIGETAKFKKESEDSNYMEEAEGLARKVI
jgi:uncharacterized protein YwgA